MPAAYAAKTIVAMIAAEIERDVRARLNASKADTINLVYGFQIWFLLPWLLPGPPTPVWKIGP